MDFLDNLARKSKFEFKIPHRIMSEAEIWSDLYGQCVGANLKLEEGISFSKMKHRINNVMLMVKTFNMLICSNRKESDAGQITTLDEERVECDRVSADCLAKEIAKHEVRLSEMESILQHNNQVSVITKEQRSMFVPNLDDPALDYDRAKLQLKINKQLFRIVENIPQFNSKLNVLMISDLFESHIEQYELSEDQKNKVFKLWVPARICQRLSSPVSAPGTDMDGNVIHGTRKDRLLQLNYIINGENVLDLEVLNDLNTSIDDDPFAFMVIFEQTYRLIMGIREDHVPQEMVQAFVKKFQYLDTGPMVNASMCNTLTEAASYIDQYRRQLVLWHSDPSNKYMIREICQSKEADTKLQKYTTCYFCHKLGHFRRKCFKLRKLIKRKGFKFDKNSVNTHEQAQVCNVTKVAKPKAQRSKLFDPLCLMNRPVCLYKRQRTEDKRSFSLLRKKGTITEQS